MNAYGFHQKGLALSIKANPIIVKLALEVKKDLQWHSGFDNSGTQWEGPDSGPVKKGNPPGIGDVVLVFVENTNNWAEGYLPAAKWAELPSQVKNLLWEALVVAKAGGGAYVSAFEELLWAQPAGQ